jgi:hypothetical protein
MSDIRDDDDIWADEEEDRNQYSEEDLIPHVGAWHDRFVAVCDRCEWYSQSYKTPKAAREAGKEHRHFADWGRGLLVGPPEPDDRTPCAACGWPYGELHRTPEGTWVCRHEVKCEERRATATGSA